MLSCRFRHIIFSALSIPMLACSGGDDTSQDVPIVQIPASSDGVLSLSLTDGGTDIYKAIYIAIHRAYVHVPDECRR